MEGTQSGPINVNNLPENKIYVARAGHPTTVEEHAKILKREEITEYGNWNSLELADPNNNPSGRVLHANNNHNNGLNGNNINNARFAGIGQAKAWTTIMAELWEQLCSYLNLELAFKSARQELTSTFLYRS